MVKTIKGVTFPYMPWFHMTSGSCHDLRERNRDKDIKKIGLRTMSRKDLWVNMEMTVNK